MTDAATYYVEFFKGWQVSRLGDKPTAEMLQTVHDLGARPGKQALAIAMAMRDVGVSNGQIVIACGAPQLNKMRGYVTDALLKRVPAPKTAAGHTVYKLELTAKGKQRVERSTKAAAKAADAAKGVEADTAKPKAKRTTKPRKATGKHASASGTVTTEPTASTLPEPDLGVTEPHTTNLPDNTL